jgi:hypothetical protein
LFFLGILEKEQEQSVVYGSTDFGKSCTTNEKYKQLVNKKTCSILMTKSNFCFLLVGESFDYA